MASKARQRKATQAACWPGCSGDSVGCDNALVIAYKVFMDAAHCVDICSGRKGGGKAYSSGISFDDLE